MIKITNAYYFLCLKKRKITFADFSYDIISSGR